MAITNKAGMKCIVNNVWGDGMVSFIRRLGEGFYIGDEVNIILLGIKEGRVKLGIEAPQTTKVVAGESYYDNIEALINEGKIQGDDIKQKLGHFGVIKFLHEAKHFGFIYCEELSQQIFFHGSDVLCTLFEVLRVGDVVRFTVDSFGEKDCARKVLVILRNKTRAKV